MKHLVFVLLLFSSVVVYSQGTPVNLKPADFLLQMQTEKNIKLIDVRTDWEFKKGHLKDAVNIDWMGEEFVSGMKDIPKSTTVFVYCFAGGRSLEAARKLLNLGYTNVYNMDGGYDAWVKAKLPITQ